MFAAFAIAFAVLAAPKLYALSVVGVTSSALLSASIGSPDPAYPSIRVLDTLLGCAIAIVFGYLLWPGRATLPTGARLGPVAGALVEYLRDAALPVDRRRRLPILRDRAYAIAHQTRAALYAALSDPPPASVQARAALPVALAFEDFADGITALASATDPPRTAALNVDRLADRITALGDTAAPSLEPARSGAASGRGSADNDLAENGLPEKGLPEKGLAEKGLAENDAAADRSSELIAALTARVALVEAAIATTRNHSHSP